MTLLSMRGVFFFIFIVCLFQKAPLITSDLRAVLKVKQLEHLLPGAQQSSTPSFFSFFLFFFPLPVRTASSTQLHNPAPLNINKALVPELLGGPPSPPAPRLASRLQCLIPVSEMMATGAEQQVGNLPLFTSQRPRSAPLNR